MPLLINRRFLPDDDDDDYDDDDGDDGTILPCDHGLEFLH